MRLPNPFKHEPVVSISAVLAFIAWLADCLHTQQLDGAAVVNWRSAALVGAVGIIRSFVYSPAAVDKAVDVAKSFTGFAINDQLVNTVLETIRHELHLPSKADADTPAELPSTEVPEVAATLEQEPETVPATETETASATAVQVPNADQLIEFGRLLGQINAIALAAGIKPSA
jgi:hypothetical protein